MKEFRIYAHPGGDVEAVKTGWSWPGFFFTCLWALIKRLWAIGAAVAVGLVVLAMVTAPPPEQAGEGPNVILIGVTLAVSAIFGQFGNSWLEGDLRERDYIYRKTVRGRNREEAVATYKQLADSDTGANAG